MQIDIVKNLMLIALNAAKIGMQKKEVPVGAVIYNMKTCKIVSIAHNLVEETKNKINHAEIVAINQMFLNNKIECFDNLAIIITFEPCIACIGCILNSRIKTIYYGLEDFKNGAFNGNNSKVILKQNNLNIYGGIFASDSHLLMKKFFFKLRLKQNKIYYK